MKNIKEIKKRDWIIILVVLLVVTGGLWIREVHLGNVKRIELFKELTVTATSFCLEYNTNEATECLIDLCDALYPAQEAVYGHSGASHKQWMDDCVGK